MHAMILASPQGPHGLQRADVAAPKPGPDEILVAVRASALNRADLLQTLGHYPAPPGVPPNIPGLEYAGEVAAVGERVTRWKAGDRVMGLVGGGAWAEFITTHEREAMAIPAGMSLTDAAAIPEAFATAFDALVLQAHMSVGQRVLIHAVASGVGLAALQLCQLYGATAIGTGRSESKLARAKGYGLEHPIGVTGNAFAKEVATITQRGCDIAMDLVGGAWFSETLEAMAPGGTIILVGLVGGATAQVPLRTLLGKRLHVHGTVLRSRPLEEKIPLARAFETHVVPHFETGKLKAVVDACVPMNEVAAALEQLGANNTFGKIVVTW